jgi:uncharacterized delta-60 repeat protein
MRTFLATLCLLLLVASAGAQTPCSLDNSFATGGKLISDASRLGEHILVQADGKILIACNPFGNGAAYIKRLNADGSTDLSYGSNGNCTIQVAEVATRITDMILLNGEVYLCGTTSTNIGGTNTYPFAAAVGSNGSLLGSFGTSGIKTFPSSWWQASAIAADGSGKLYVAGLSSLTNLFVLKLNTSGAYDNTFDGDGIAQLATNNNDHWFDVFDLLIDKDNKPVLCGKKYRANNGSTAPNFWNILAVRFSTSGSPDNTFGNSGVALFNSNTQWFDEGKNIHALPNGQYIITGDTYDNTDYDYTVIRVNNNGTLDNTFGNGGWQIHDLEFNNEFENPLNSAVLPDGRILITGNQGSGDTVYFCLLMLHPDGTRDNNFAPNGLFKNIFGLNNNSSSSGLAVEPGGKIILGGYTRTCANGVCGPLSMALARYKSGAVPAGLTSSDMSEPQRLSVWPNPVAAGQWVFTAPADEIRVYDMSGQLQFRGKGPLPAPGVPGLYRIVSVHEKSVSSSTLLVR